MNHHLNEVTEDGTNAVPDVDLVENVLAGHKDDFAHLVRRYQNRIYGTVYKVLQNPREAEDAAQEIFFKAYKSLSMWKRDASFATWLYRIAMNHCVDVTRRKKPEQALALGSFGDDGLTGTSERSAYLGFTTAPSEAPEAVLLQRELQACIDHAMGQLPLEVRAVVTLRLFADLSFQEIAETLNIPVQTAKMRFYRAKQKLRMALSEQGLAPIYSKEGVR